MPIAPAGGPVPVHVLGEGADRLRYDLRVIPAHQRHSLPHISMSCVFQNLAGLQNRYPQNQWQEILGNSDVQLFLGCTDQLTAERLSAHRHCQCSGVQYFKALNTLRVSDYTPQYRESSGVGKRPVLTPDEVLRLPVDEALVILRGHKSSESPQDGLLCTPHKQLRGGKASAHILGAESLPPETSEVLRQKHLKHRPRCRLNAAVVPLNQKRWLPPTKNPS